MKDGKELSVKVEERTGRQVKYFLTDSADGPLISVNLRQVRSIKYSDGTIEYGSENPRINKPFGVSAGTIPCFSSRLGSVLLLKSGLIPH